jgi:hypothetical protein
VGQSHGVAGRKQDTAYAIDDLLCDATAAATHNRGARSHGLDDNTAKGLRLHGWNNRNIERREQGNRIVNVAR